MFFSLVILFIYASSDPSSPFSSPPRSPGSFLAGKNTNSLPMERQTIPGSSHRPHFRRYRGHNQSESSESALSEHESIYDAARTGSSAAEGSSSQQNRGLHGSDIGGNVAMFLPDSPDIPGYESSAEQRKGRVRWRRSQSLPRNWMSSSKANDPLADLFKDAKSKMSDLRLWGRRRALSLGDAENGPRGKWAATLISPVRPLLPKYPPPIRSPTPPGVPSFGSPEAINYTTQFCVRSSLPNGRGQQHGPPPEQNRPATESYAQTLRRFLGFSSPTVTPQANRRQGQTFARAEDGTAVQGRFPYRASGHGLNVGRHLEDHPFHRRAFPVPHPGSRNVDERVYTRGEPSRAHPDSTKDEATTRAGRTDPHSNRMARSYFPRMISSLSSVPEPTVSTFPHRPVSELPSPSPASNSQYYSCMSQPQQGVTLPTMPTYDGEIDHLGNGRIDYNGYYMTPPSLLQSMPAVQTPESGIPQWTPRDRDLWMGYEMFSPYVFCCCTNEDDEDDDDDTASGYNSRASGETYATALSWPDNATDYYLNQYHSSQVPGRQRSNTLTGRSSNFSERYPRPLQRPEHMLM